MPPSERVCVLAQQSAYEVSERTTPRDRLGTAGEADATGAAAGDVREEALANEKPPRTGTGRLKQRRAAMRGCSLAGCARFVGESRRRFSRYRSDCAFAHTDCLCVRYPATAVLAGGSKTTATDRLPQGRQRSRSVSLAKPATTQPPKVLIHVLVCSQEASRGGSLSVAPRSLAQRSPLRANASAPVCALRRGFNFYWPQDVPPHASGKHPG